jgi:glycopeptide antibiotics resistance protein
MLTLLLLTTFWKVMAVIGFILLAVILCAVFRGPGELVMWILYGIWFDD